MKNIPRNTRRRIARNADKIAKVMAATAASVDRSGTMHYLAPKTLRTVERAFAAMLRNGCKPIVMEISEDAGRALGRGKPPPPLPDVKWFIAAGLDVEGCATFTTAWAMTLGLPEAEAHAEAERILLENLAEGCNTPGLPAWEVS